MEHLILHVDANNFFASVAVANNPSLKGRAVAVCGAKDERHGIVLAKSNIAKGYGIKTGDTVSEARRKAPDLVIVPPDYKQYAKYSYLLYNLYIDYTPNVESFGLDECWLDVTGCEKEYGSGENLANIIRERIKKEIGLTVSVGVSFTKIFAKIGSDYKKPDATTVITKENYKDIIWNLNVEEMLFVGRSVKAKLQKLGIKKIGQLANMPIKDLKDLFGKVGEKIYNSANGIEDEGVKLYTDKHIPESVSNGTTPVHDITNTKDATSLIYSLCEIIAYRLRQNNLVAQGVAIHIRDTDLCSMTRQEKLISPTSNSSVISQKALEILGKHYSFSENLPLRAITIATYGLISASDMVQLSFIEDNHNCQIDKNIDNLRKKYGFNVLKLGVELDPEFGCEARAIEDGFLPFDKKNI
ncbi:MAG: DNA polymerase IV [Clostridia bacterium]